MEILNLVAASKKINAGEKVVVNEKLAIDIIIWYTNFDTKIDYKVSDDKKGIIIWKV